MLSIRVGLELLLEEEVFGESWLLDEEDGVGVLEFLEVDVVVGIDEGLIVGELGVAGGVL